STTQFSWLNFLGSCARAPGAMLWYSKACFRVPKHGTPRQPGQSLGPRCGRTEKIVRRSVVFAPRKLEHAQGRSDLRVDAWEPRSAGAASWRGSRAGGDRDLDSAGEAAHRVGSSEGLVAGRDEHNPGREAVRAIIIGL